MFAFGRELPNYCILFLQKGFEWAYNMDGVITYHCKGLAGHYIWGPVAAVVVAEVQSSLQ